MIDILSFVKHHAITVQHAKPEINQQFCPDNRRPEYQNYNEVL
jgi:hypothetical protein